MITVRGVLIFLATRVLAKCIRKYLVPPPDDNYSTYTKKYIDSAEDMGETLSPSTTNDPPKKKLVQSNKTKSDKNSPVEQPAKKSILITYILWLFGGVFGLHHLYLHRDFQAFVHWSTFVGYFGIGWIVDFFKIPSYVKDCNEDPNFIKEYVAKIQEHRRPPFSTYRFTAAICVAYLWGNLAMIAVPQEDIFSISLNFLHWTIPLMIALGVWAVGNIGREKGALWHSLVASYVTYLTRYFLYDDTIWMTLTVFATATVFDHMSKQWRLEKPIRKPLWRRSAVLTGAIIIYMSLWVSYLYFNGTITDSDGDEIPVHEAIHNFIKSPWWTDLKQTLSDTYVFAQHNGWSEIWKQIIDQLDADGEQNAFRTLGLSATASQSEIKTSWKRLSLENHPDKAKDEQKEIAHEKFMEIQQAYEILSKIKSKRRSRNKKYNEEL